MPNWGSVKPSASRTRVLGLSTMWSACCSFRSPYIMPDAMASSVCFEPVGVYGTLDVELE